MRISSVIAFVLALGLAVVARWGWEEHRQFGDFAFARLRLAQLEEENVRLRALLAQQRRSSGASVAARTKIQEEVAKIRHLHFQKPVVYEALSRERIKQTIRNKLSEEYSDLELEHVATGLAAVGVLPAHYPLKEKYIDLLGEQIAAFYDQHQHELFMFEDASLESAQNRVVLAHELAHALQDQNFGLQNLPLEIKTNDDRAAAASALIEGDATLVMSEFMLNNQALQSLGENLSNLMSQDMSQLENAPRFLREMLLFPYLRGQEFCATIKARGGYEALTHVYTNPPASTAQVLHPEKYLAHEAPVVVPWSETAVNGTAPIADNVLGEMGIRILLEDSTDQTGSTRAAEGWRGDRYVVFGDGEALAWRTVWATAEDAAEFFAAVQKCVQQRYGLAPGTNADEFLAASPRWIELRRLAGNEVFLIDAATEVWANSLREKFGR
jgi:hypothetical protein